jgi:hypothetical protein
VTTTRTTTTTTTGCHGDTIYNSAFADNYYDFPSFLPHNGTRRCWLFRTYPSRDLPAGLPAAGEPVPALPMSSAGNKVTLAGMRFRDKFSKFIRPSLSMPPPHPTTAAHHASSFCERFKFFEFSAKCCVKLIVRYGWHVQHARLRVACDSPNRMIAACRMSSAISHFAAINTLHTTARIEKRMRSDETFAFDRTFSNESLFCFFSRER